jgi:hypothetical protein
MRVGAQRGGKTIFRLIKTMKLFPLCRFAVVSKIVVRPKLQLFTSCKLKLNFYYSHRYFTHHSINKTLLI